MTYYLYVKTHNKTGLKYLGKTQQEERFHRYPGSGIRWRNHLKVHGYDVTTEIIGTYETEEQFKEAALYYSKLWNIVESDEWANLKPETGDGNPKGILFSEEHRRKMGKSRIGNKNSLGYHHSEETKEKHRVAALKRTHSEETIQKMKKSATELWKKRKQHD